MALVVDTGPLYAWFDADDPDHERCGTLLETAEAPLVVPTPVLVELEWLSTSRGGGDAFAACIENIESGGFELYDLAAPDYRRALTLMQKYADFPLGLVDASVVAVCERLGERKVATLDHRHFGAVRPAHVRRLRLLPDA